MNDTYTPRRASAESSDEPRQKGGSPRRVRTSWGRLAVEFVVVFVVGLTLASILHHFYPMFVVPSTSMQPTLGVNERIVVTGAGAKLHRGDVVVFADEQQWVTPTTPSANPIDHFLIAVGVKPDDSKTYLVKRVVGLPGDRVASAGGGAPITVNSVAITEPYLYPGDNASDYPFDLTIPNGTMFVLGDHRSDSADSRCHFLSGQSGLVQQSTVVGVVGFSLKPWPTAVSRGTAFDAVPEPASSSDLSIIVTMPQCG